MDERLKLRATKRTDVSHGLAEVPLVTMAWRALRAEHKRRSDEDRRLLDALCRMAEDVHRLRRTLRRLVRRRCDLDR